MSANGLVIGKGEVSPSGRGYSYETRLRTLESDMAVIRTLIKQNNDTLTAIMDAIKQEQTK